MNSNVNSERSQRPVDRQWSVANAADINERQDCVGRLASVVAPGGKLPTRAIFAVLASALYLPSRVYLSNVDKYPHLERVVLIVGLYWLIGVLWYAGCRKLGWSEMPAIASSTILVVLLSSGRNLARYMPWQMGLLASLLIAVLVLIIVARVHWDLQRIIATALPLFLIAGLVSPVFALVIGRADSSGAVQVRSPTSTIPDMLESTPDIFLVVVDGKVGEVALEETYGMQPQEVGNAGAGLSGWASYPVSVASVASMLEMGHVLEEGAVLDGHLRSELAGMMAGDNRAVRFLRDAGYRTTLVESGWSRSFCGGEIDLCIDSRFLDEGTFEILRQSIIGRWLESTKGSALTIGAEHSMEWLLTNAERISSDNVADLVLATVLVPHPPLFLDSSCGFHYDPLLGGNGMFIGEFAIERRSAAYIEQLKCANEFERKLLDRIGSDDVAIIVSDHGSDRQGQLKKVSAEWTFDDRVERLSVYVNTRLPEGCEPRQRVMLVDVIRDALWCLAGDTTVSPVEPRVFITSFLGDPKRLQVVELSEQERDDLIALSD